MRLFVSTPNDWAQTALADLDGFLLDHAACERKAFSSAMMLVSKYRDKQELVTAMIELAREELEHFHDVYLLIVERGLCLAAHEKDRYAQRLLCHVRADRAQALLDRLLVAGIIEARSCERLGLFAAALPPGKLKDFYLRLTRAEARHHALFVRLAKVYFAGEMVDARLNELLRVEADIIQELPHAAVVH